MGQDEANTVFSLEQALMEHSGLCISAHAIPGAFPIAEWELCSTCKNELQGGSKY